MAGRRYGRFRGGDVAESLGALLLKSVATVAEVPRPEDVGIDAVANLLRSDADGSIYAEDAFTVQFKSSKAKPIEFEPHEIHWFMNLALPHFIGRVDLEATSVELFTTHFVRSAILAGHPTRVRLSYQMDASQEACMKAFGYPHYLENDLAIVWMGEPVLTLRLPSDGPLNDIEQYYAAMKSFLWADRIALQFTRLGVATSLIWNTNQGVIDARSIGLFGSRAQEGLRECAEFASPLFVGLLTYSFASRATRATDSEREPTTNSLWSAIGELAESLAERGIGNPESKIITYWDELYRSLLLRHSQRCVANTPSA